MGMCGCDGEIVSEMSGSIIMAFVTFKALALYRENTVQMHAQNGVDISFNRIYMRYHQ